MTKRNSYVSLATRPLIRPTNFVDGLPDWAWPMEYYKGYSRINPADIVADKVYRVQVGGKFTVNSFAPGDGGTITLDVLGIDGGDGFAKADLSTFPNSPPDGDNGGWYADVSLGFRYGKEFDSSGENIGAPYGTGMGQISFGNALGTYVFRPQIHAPGSFVDDAAYYALGLKVDGLRAVTLETHFLTIEDMN